MGKYSKVVRQKKKSQNSFIPESWKAFFARRIVNIVSFSFIGIGLWMVMALVSYDRLDPSWNTAALDADIQNWLGRSGAYMSDLSLQTFGLGAFIFVVCAVTIGFRIHRKQPITAIPLRVAAMCLSVLFMSLFCSQFTNESWLPAVYLGGSAGVVVHNGLSSVLHHVLGQNTLPVVSWFAAVLLVPALCIATATPLRFIPQCLMWAVYSTKLGLAMTYNAVISAIDWVKHYSDPAYLPDQSRKIKVAKAKKVEPKTKKLPVSNVDTASAPMQAAPKATETVKLKSAASGIRVVNPVKATGSQPKQTKLSLYDSENWEFPGLDLLQVVPQAVVDEIPDEKALRENAEMLQSVLADFNIEGEIVSIHPGPVVTLYELEPAPGIKTARVISLSDDIARSMAAISVRCSVVPGRNVIGIELPNDKRQTVYMREMLEARDVQKSKPTLPLILGKDIGGAPVVADLAKMPHLLVAGTTGSGKSVSVNTMVLSLLYRLPPEKCRFIMIDPKMLELSVYNDIPHLLSPVVTEPGKAVVALKWAVMEMEDRYRAMSRLGVRSIDGYNKRLEEARKKGEVLMRKVQTGFDPETGKPTFEEQPMDMTDIPYIVIIVDEFADLMLVAGKDVESAIQRLAQMARAAGIHLIMATQRPSTDVITGVIKANFPTRISFSVTSKIDSRVILGDGGAEQLLGMGDMLYMAPGGAIKRVHGPFVSDDEVESVVSFLKAQGQPNYVDDVTEGGEGGSEVMNALFGDGDDDGGVDELYDKAVAIVARERKASTSYIQRQLRIGYNRAACIIEEMERQGVIGPANHVGKREVLVSDYSEAS